MREWVVTMVGTDDELHTKTVRASSVFHAAAQARQDWSRYYWWRTDAVIEVRLGEQCWRVRNERLREWVAETGVESGLVATTSRRSSSHRSYSPELQTGQFPSANRKLSVSDQSSSQNGRNSAAVATKPLRVRDSRYSSAV
jgi:hypothetical protein